MPATAVAIITRPLAISGARNRAMASHPIPIAISTSETPLATAAKMPTRW